MKKEQDRGFWFKMTENKDVHLSPIARAQKLQLAFEQPSTGGCWNPPRLLIRPGLLRPTREGV